MIKKIKYKIYKWFKSTYTGDKFFYRKNLNSKYNFSHPLVLIYTMGKVGSASIYESIKDCSSFFNIIHLHKLNGAYLRDREHFIKKKIYGTNQYPKGIYTDLLWTPLWVRKLISTIKKPVYVITAVREPIGRNISLFFQWIDFEEKEDTYSFKSRNNNYPFNITTSKNDLSKLYDYFLNSFTKDSHNDWLRDELKYVFKVDLLTEPFDKEKGYSVIKNEKIQLLTLKLEKFNSTFEEAVADFLNEKVELLKVNEASTKKIQDIYRRFKNEIQLPKDYIDTLYSSEFVQHFYTPAEIEVFYLKWTNKTP